MQRDYNIRHLNIAKILTEFWVNNQRKWEWTLVSTTVTWLLGVCSRKRRGHNMTTSLKGQRWEFSHWKTGCISDICVCFHVVTSRRLNQICVEPSRMRKRVRKKSLHLPLRASALFRRRQTLNGGFHQNFLLQNAPKQHGYCQSSEVHHKERLRLMGMTLVS